VLFDATKRFVLVWRFCHWKNKVNTSPVIAETDLTAKSRTEIRDLAKRKSLVPMGDPTDTDYPRKWKDPVTGKERLRLDRGHVDPLTGKPYSNPNAAIDHLHGYGADGVTRILVNGDPHIPTVGE
jgi:hypothetical protein